MGCSGMAPRRAVWSHRVLWEQGTRLRVRGAPWADEKPQGIVLLVAGWARGEARAVQGPYPPFWASSPLRLLPPTTVTSPAAFQCVSPALG